LIIAGTDDHTVPLAITHVTDKIPGRGHSLVIDSGWRAVADPVLSFIQIPPIRHEFEWLWPRLGTSFPADDADNSLRRWIAYAVHLGQSWRGTVRITICRSVRRVLSRMSMPGWFSGTSASVPLSSTRTRILPVVFHRARAMPPL
jgi:hypothetical protein